MAITKEQIKEFKLTELEVSVLNPLLTMLPDDEPGFSDVTVEDLSNYTGFQMKVIRGVISSLIKKEIIFLASLGTPDTFIYLVKKNYKLKPEYINF